MLQSSTTFLTPNPTILKSCLTGRDYQSIFEKQKFKTRWIFFFEEGGFKLYCIIMKLINSDKALIPHQFYFNHKKPETQLKNSKSSCHFHNNYSPIP